MSTPLSRRVAFAAVVALAAAAGTPAGAVSSEAGPTRLAVTFRVENANRSAVNCPTDGRPYTISGHLVLPAGATPSGVTLYLHGLGHGEWLWGFDAAPGYRHAVEMARLGHASVTVDRLGYDASGHPQGTQTCVGAHADVAHQIVGALRSGAYEVQGGNPPAFSRVALAGLSVGGMIAQVEAHTFGGIDALAVMSYADQGASPATFRTLQGSGEVCLRGGEEAEAGQPGGYAYFGQTDADFEALMFHNADPPVAAAATKLRNRDPCGDFASLASGVTTNQSRIGGITVPVFLACGRQDAVFPPPACEDQAGHYRSSPKVTSLLLDGAGHMLPLQRTAPALRAALGSWLAEQGI